MSHDALSTDDQERGFIWNFRVIARIGATRDDKFGNARYEKLKVEPEEAYREGMRLYMSRQFLAAAYQFGKVVSLNLSHLPSGRSGGLLQGQGL